MIHKRMTAGVLSITVLATLLATFCVLSVYAAPPAISASVLDACYGAINPDDYYGKPYLTWQGDPCTTITINYHTASKPAFVVVQYDAVSKPPEYSFSSVGKSWQIPNLADGRYVNSVEITGLEAGKEYFFRIGDYTDFSDEYKFRTIPNDNTPIRFAIGGDSLATPAFGNLVEFSSALDPDFLVIGGDLAYANGDVEQVDQWNNWLGRWHYNAKTTTGRLIPLVMALGNHETNKLENVTFEERAPFFYGFFPQGGKTFWAHQFGGNLGFIFLDSGHLEQWEDQAPWLEEQLKALQAVPFRVAAYHVPLYPSHRDYEGSNSVAGRTHWLPLFDKYELAVGFEHHDHTFKRTKRLRNNEINPEGTLYVGDGNAGVMPRVPKEGLWYMEKVARDTHFWIVDVSQNEMHLRAMNRSGEIFDEVTLQP